VGQHDADGVDSGLSAGTNRAVRRCDATGNGAHVDDAASLSEILHSGLRNKEEAQYVYVEVPVKVPLGDSLEGGCTRTCCAMSNFSPPRDFLVCCHPRCIFRVLVSGAICSLACPLSNLEFAAFGRFCFMRPR
jgi:hypothetical protein